ncbi:MAG: T9SS type A sorting domain-containing protein [Bacteroidota bacterium]
MKKNYFILCSLLALTVSVFSQSQRFVLFEEFTNASCSPCASQNPAFDALLTANASKCTSIKYHTSWPGTDPMYSQNPADANTRVSYYGVTGVPYAAMDGSPVNGTSYSGAPANTTQSKIDAEYAIPSPFELYINQALSPGNDTLYVTMLGKATAAVSGVLNAQCVVVEKHIHFASAPGSNGEKDFYNVMKKMLPTSAGTTLPSSFQVGDYFVLQFAWKLSNVYTLSELNVVGFIQDIQTKTVFQAANTSSTPITGIYQNDLELSGLANVLPSYCQPSCIPQFTLSNNGSDPISTAEIKYRVNNEPESVYHYSGSLGFLQKTMITLPTVGFNIQNTNTLKIFGTTVNGVADDYASNDTISYNFTIAPMSGLQATVLVKTDNNPGETTWEIKDLQGNVVSSGGPYTQSVHTYTTDVNLDFATCYKFTIHDSGGNGVCCSSGIGFYKVSSGSTTIASGTAFGSGQTSQFYSPSNVGLPEQDAASVALYPNPVNQATVLSFANTSDESVSVMVYDMQGAIVLSLPGQEYRSGRHEIALDCSRLNPGTYNVRLTTGNKIFNQRMSVVR